MKCRKKKRKIKKSCHKLRKKQDNGWKKPLKNKVKSISLKMKWKNRFSNLAPKMTY